MPTTFSFESIENKHFVYRGTDCMKTFSEFLRELAKKIIYFKKEKKSSYSQKSNRNHMKIQKSVIFVMKSLEIIL